jgi:CPA2 family monovalent cation:H+ antiporter-2
MVLALVLLPAFAVMLGGHGLAGDAGHGGGEADTSIAMSIVTTLAKVGAFVAVAALVGPRVVPWILIKVARTGSRELFTLSVLAIALGIAFGSAAAFGVSFALGAFFAGVIMSESNLSHRAAANSLPLQDAFSVLFFVSIGMLFDPFILVQRPLEVLAVLALIILGKGVIAFAIVVALRYPIGMGLGIAASLAQIGEFSFILVGLGVSLALLPTEGRDLVLAGAILSILVNPLVFWLAERTLPAAPRSPVPPPPPAPAAEPGHEVLVGYGRVGGLIGRRLAAAGRRVVVIETSEDAVAAARRDGARAILGNAADPEVLAEAGLAAARRIFVAIPEAFEAGQVVEQARAARPDLEILARADSEAAVEHLARLGATLTVMGEREIAHRMLERALGRAAHRAAPAAG